MDAYHRRDGWLGNQKRIFNALQDSARPCLTVQDSEGQDSTWHFKTLYRTMQNRVINFTSAQGTFMSAMPIMFSYSNSCTRWRGNLTDPHRMRNK